LKVIIIGEDSSHVDEAMLRMVCSKLGIPVEVVQNIKKEDLEKKELNCIIEELLICKPPQIPILEIPIFFEELPKKKERTYSNERFYLIDFVGQPKTVRIRSPCKTGIFYFAKIGTPPHPSFSLLLRSQGLLLSLRFSHLCAKVPFSSH
jgi:hypothetical protein